MVPQSLDDKSEESVWGLRVTFNIDLSFSKMRRLYSPKFKKACTHKQRKNKKGGKRSRQKLKKSQVN